MPGMDNRDRQYRDATVLNHGERRKVRPRYRAANQPSRMPRNHFAPACSVACSVMEDKEHETKSAGMRRRSSAVARQRLPCDASGSLVRFAWDCCQGFALGSALLLMLHHPPCHTSHPRNGSSQSRSP